MSPNHLYRCTPNMYISKQRPTKTHFPELLNTMNNTYASCYLQHLTAFVPDMAEPALTNVFSMQSMQLSAEWLPTSTVVYQPPSQRLGDLVTYSPDSAEGPRESAEMAQLAAVAQTMVPQPPGIERDLCTTYQTSFVRHNTSDLR